MGAQRIEHIYGDPRSCVEFIACHAYYLRCSLAGPTVPVSRIDALIGTPPGLFCLFHSWTSFEGALGKLITCILHLEELTKGDQPLKPYDSNGPHEDNIHVKWLVNESSWITFEPTCGHCLIRMEPS